MLDVHPPHAPTHTWKDFFIHIATIVVGLLIAVGLEQTVEWFHHRHQVEKAHAALETEFEVNLLSFHANVAYYRFNSDALRNDLTVMRFLKEHPGTQEPDLPGTLLWSSRFESATDAAWKVAEQEGVVALLPRDEVSRDDQSYIQLKHADETQDKYWVALNRARHFLYLDPDPTHLSPTELDREIALLEDCFDLNFQWGVSLENETENDARFVPSPSREDLKRDAGVVRSETDRLKLRVAQQQTDARTAAAVAAIRQAEDAIDAHQKTQP